LAEELGVHDLMHQRASRLSGGQAQRVAVVRALLKEPTIVLADEPTGNLDDVSASAVLGALYSHAAAEGRVCLVVTHDQRVADSAGHVYRLPGAHSTTAAPE
jgi:ABC-type lipoprotein export system ATPase subunit